MNIKTIGLEKEFFLRKGDEYCLAPDAMPRDDCGWLAEARGEPSKDPNDSKFLLLSSIEKLNNIAAKHGLTLIDSASEPLPRELMRCARRDFGKARAKSYFAHGGAYRSDRPRAGLHVHFGMASDVTYEGKVIRTWQDYSDIPRIIWMMDCAFKDEIRKSKRVAGEYEIKSWGWEYRSLPSNADLNKVVETINSILLTR